ncbi:MULTISPECIES: hypothetical protein [Haloferacaceae]|uniref:Uncharacterized protein n=1 Tax=Halorubrum glutamatedens TaxID=2707018 RepID=A0ABD5QVF4_9EURY
MRLPLIDTLAGHLDEVVGHPDPSVEQPARGGVPRELSAKTVTGDGHFMTSLLAADHLEGTSHSAVDPIGSVLVGRFER